MYTFFHKSLKMDLRFQPVFFLGSKSLCFIQLISLTVNVIWSEKKYPGLLLMSEKMITPILLYSDRMVIFVIAVTSVPVMSIKPCDFSWKNRQKLLSSHNIFWSMEKSHPTFTDITLCIQHFLLVFYVALQSMTLCFFCC